MEEQLTNLSIKAWAEDDRPREKLLAKGRQALSDAELVAILIGSGSAKESAVALCQRILGSVDNNLNELGKLSVEELMQFKGIGEAKAISIVAALELGRRRGGEELAKRKKINSSEDIFAIFHQRLADLPHEEFWVLVLNRANKVLDKFAISKGGVSGTVVDARLIFKQAVDKLASSIVLCHNHPSGNIQPSQSDKELTTKLRDAGELLEIKVLDHLIIGHGEYYSFADEGQL